MNKLNIVILFALTGLWVFSPCHQDHGKERGNAQEADPIWNLVWSDEFNSDTINTNYWTIQDSYWKKNPKCLYKPAQVTIKNGNLIISAIAIADIYHTGQIKSDHKVEIGYGKLELRIKMPEGAGLKTAFWMLGVNKDTVGWPRCGEIDIVEQRGFEPNITHHNIHWYNENESKFTHNGYQLKSENELTEEWHVYSLIRDEKKISYFMDGKLFNEYIIVEEMAEFKNLYYFIIQLDIGNENNWPGPVNEHMDWPKNLYIDYVRYYRCNSLCH